MYGLMLLLLTSTWPWKLVGVQLYPLHMQFGWLIKLYAQKQITPPPPSLLFMLHGITIIWGWGTFLVLG